MYSSECENQVKRKITRIEPQKKRKHRRSIFLDDEFAFGLDEEIIYRYGLKEGDEIADSDIEKLLLSEEKKAAKDRALHFLTHRARSEKEVRDKLNEVGYDPPIVDWAIAELKRLKLLDDVQFAVSFARSKMVTRPAGEHLLRRELKLKGIPDELIEKAIVEAYLEKSQREVAQELAEKRSQQYKNLDPQKARKRIADFLLRRGFDWEVVSEVIESRSRQH
ncbi:MAG: RecX family transcriptional regulator [candidate division KSB1 bacterium]|nr:RecX family transcriptional regulator [candidate division KSB1 bacterium]